MARYNRDWLERRVVPHLQAYHGRTVINDLSVDEAVDLFRRTRAKRKKARKAAKASRKANRR